MEFLVVFSDPMPDIPADTRARLLKMLEEVAASLGDIPTSSVVWESLEGAPLQLDLHGWRFMYSVTRAEARVIVLEHKDLKDGADPAARRKRSRR